jgi:XTP/dITP diphosphohydrolase
MPPPPTPHGALGCTGFVYFHFLFSIVNYARFLNIDPDQALARTNKKFIKRFQAMEEVVAAEGKQMTDLNLAEMDAIWNTVKLSERG